MGYVITIILLVLFAGIVIKVSREHNKNKKEEKEELMKRCFPLTFMQVSVEEPIDQFVQKLKEKLKTADLPNNYSEERSVKVEIDKTYNDYVYQLTGDIMVAGVRAPIIIVKGYDQMVESIRIRFFDGDEMHKNGIVDMLNMKYAPKSKSFSFMWEVPGLKIKRERCDGHHEELVYNFTDIKKRHEEKIYNDKKAKSVYL